MTLTDREYQRLRDIGIAVHPRGRRRHRRLQHPVRGEPARRPPRRHRDEPAGVALLARWRRKATGFPIAKIAAKLAIGYTLDEIPNDITAKTPASFEPTLDYVVVKVPRFAFEKFPAADAELTTTMKSVGEAMAIGRNFTEALQRRCARWSSAAPRSLDGEPGRREPAAARARCAGRRRTTAGCTVERALPRRRRRSSRCTRRPAIDPWFLDQIVLLDELARRGRATPRCSTRRAAAPGQAARVLRRADRRAARAAGEDGVRAGAARASASGRSTRPWTPAPPSSPRPRRTTTRPTTRRTRSRRRTGRKVMILGCGPNRIGQGIEFDYSCVHASFALRAAGYETVMVNCNPETVSTDYDTSDRLYFEPLTFEDVLEVVHAETARPAAGWSA